MIFKLATWNVNSVRSRLTNIINWLTEVKPDVLLLQETKCLEEQFPSGPFSDLFYNLAVKGQKSYNGVAILSKEPIDLISNTLPGDDSDQQARFLEFISNGVRIINIYAPNGNPIDDPIKFPYKLSWMKRLINHTQSLQQEKVPLVIAGDYNVLPTDADCYEPKNFIDDAIAQPETRALWRELLKLGLKDTLLEKTNNPKNYTYWSYRGKGWPRGHGLRIDHYLVNSLLWPRIQRCYVDKKPRAKDHASDHTPLILEYQI